MSQTETHTFQAETSEVLKLVIHSLYSHKEIFLRELISNASDACDKLRFEAVQNADLLGSDGDPRIDIVPDKDARTLEIRDLGIGMSRQELIDNLGTIARSGTKQFMAALSEAQKGDAQLIGQFGVGFYSGFIVADRIEVISRRAGSSEAWRWVSTGTDAYTLEPAKRAERGTSIVLHLKEDESEFLNDWTLRNLIRRYSDHIGFPIRLPKPGKVGDEESSGNTGEMETVNQAAALWTLPKNDIKDDEYQAFYKHISHDFGEALSWTHNRVEGNQNFTSLLFLPAKAPMDLAFDRDQRKGLKLYVKRVFIMDAAEQMLPAYLRFVRGVVDSDDLPLNVSRELLQNNRQVEKLKSALTRRVLDLLDKLAREDKDKYAQFWSAFGNVLKEGAAEDFSNQERIAKLLRFATTRSSNADERFSLEDYVARMKTGQKAIYFLSADGWNAAANSPQLEALKARDIEVILLHERIDEWMAGYLREFEGKSWKNIAKGDLDLGDLPDAAEVKAKHEEAVKAAASTIDALKTALGDKVHEVRVSSRLTDSPSCLVLEEYDMALHMQRLMRAAGHEVPTAKPSLEINPEHPLLKRFDMLADGAERESLALVLFEQAQLAEGAPLDDPAGFIKRVNALLLNAA
ncbi:MAG: Chaperone protein HtpG [Alphaproteobacteria bacterium ADurb.BinA280]|jgi:molecular chaperone HtpG|nr:MAG: Chaperone protein HtpG [Alphaproteobacteria bacterium ADurb.BinA280]